MDRTGLEHTPEGRQWLAASAMALTDAQAVPLPYRQHGFFPAGKPRAMGLEFKARRGEQLQFSIEKKSLSSFVVYMELFRKEGAELTPVYAADTANGLFHFDASQTGTYVLRIQPELFQTGHYSLSISVGPSLFFPVSGKSAKVGSFWGDSRDGGKRRHEGIDIFAPKRTPVVAAADGIVTGVKEEGIGGKTVWLRAEGQEYTLYYAHLDKQLVHTGQLVKKGEVLGLVGNTGNARYTPSHLHFGVYTVSGPVDPFPFVNPQLRTAAAPASRELGRPIKLSRSQKANGTMLPASTVLIPLAVHENGFIAELPDGRLIQAPFTITRS